MQAFKIVVDSWKFSMLLLYIFWDDWPIFMISTSNEQLLQQLEYTLLKPDCHNWWISKMQSGREDTLEERYAIKFCFKLGKNAMETYGMLQTAFWPSCMTWASVFEWHKRFKEARESVRVDFLNFVNHDRVQMLSYNQYSLLFINSWDRTCNLQMISLGSTFQPNAYIRCAMWIFGTYKPNVSIHLWDTIHYYYVWFFTLAHITIFFHIVSMTIKLRSIVRIFFVM